MRPDIAPLPYREHVRDKLLSTSALHAGLFYERFFPCWEERDFSLYKPLSTVLEAFCSQFGQTGRDTTFADLLAACHSRLDRLVRMRQGMKLMATCTAPLASGLGIDHPADNGFVFDHGCGVPYLPGSSIKGLCRAWAKICGKERHVEELLGPETMEEGSGRLIFLPAYPATWPELICDVICNHHREYYSKEPDQRKYTRNEFPTPMDIESPVPINHLALAGGTEFVFRILPLDRETAADDLARAGALLAEALRELGIGARTAVGYGTMELQDTDTEKIAATWEKPIMTGIIRTFVSYSHQDKQRVNGFLARGAMRGIAPWLDRQNMLPAAGHSIEESLEQAIRDGGIAAITLFLTEHSLGSDWVAKEMELARKYDKHVIPILDAQDDQVVDGLARMVRPHRPYYLKLGDDDALFSLLSTLVRESGADAAGEVVLYLGHREDKVHPSGLPETWEREYPVIDLRTGDHRLLEVREWDFQDWLPQDADEYEQYGRAIRDLSRALGRVEHLRVAGFAPLGIAGLIGKYWDRGSSVGRITSWNNRDGEEWSVERMNPPEAGPEDWRYLTVRDDEDMGQGEDILVGHFTQAMHMDAVRNWVKKQEFPVGRTIRFEFPQTIDADTAPTLALEIVQSLGWARQKYGAATVYWAAGIPMALMPLITYLARARGRTVFLDCNLKTGDYIRAFELY